MKKSVLILLLGVFLVSFIFIEGTNAATYWVSPSGSGSTCSESSPCSLSTGIGSLSGGDTLILKDGTYLRSPIINPPSGSPGAFTIIKAENEGSVLIDGERQIGTVLNISSSYVRVEGITFVNAGGSADVASISGNFIEVKRSGFANTNGHHYASIMSIGGRNILVEDCWFWGTGRAGISVGGEYITLRRIVSRMDYYDGSHEHMAILLYGAKHVIAENVIAINFNPSPQATPYPESFRNGFRSRAGYDAVNHSFYGAIALNLPNPSYYGYGGFELAVANCYHCIAWDVGSHGFRQGSWESGYFLSYPTAGQTGSTPISENNMQVSNSLVNPSSSQLSYLPSPSVSNGAKILYRYENGVLTSTPLWPWPYEDRIKSDFLRTFDNIPTQYRNNVRGFTSSGNGLYGGPITLTSYIWEYLGNACPPEICNYGTPPPQDTTPPSQPTNLVTTPVSGSQINLAWTASTDNVGVVAYEVYRCTGTTCTPTTLIGTPATNSFSSTGLTSETTYRYRVRAYDAAGNFGSYSSIVSGTTLTSDTEAPIRTNGQPTGNLPAGTTSTTISLTTNEAATCRYSLLSGRTYSQMTTTFSTTGGTSHSQLISGLSNGNTYTFYVKCIDGSGNANTDDYPISFSVLSSLPQDDCTPVSIRCVGSDKEYITIQSAVSAAQPGDTVLVFSGTYQGFRVTTSGTSGNPIVIKAKEGENVIINLDSSYGHGIFLRNVNYIELDGFTIQDVNQRCIAAREATATNPMRGLIIQNIRCLRSGEEGFYLSQVSNSLIQNNYISATGLSGSVGGTVSHGIYLANAGSKNTIIRNNTIERNPSYSSYSMCIHINGDLSVGGDGIISGLIIEDNKLMNCYRNALNFDGVQDSDIRNNLVYAPGNRGVRAYRIDGAQGPRNLRIYSNTFLMTVDNSWSIKLSEDLGGHTIFNNIMLHERSSGGSLSLENSNFISNNNIFVNRMSRDGESSVISLSNWKTQTGQDSNSVVSSSSLVFVAHQSNDFHLRGDSPAIDTGLAILNSVSAPSKDIEGNLRPQGSAQDIGAYEYFDGQIVIPDPDPEPEPPSEPPQPPQTTGIITLQDMLNSYQDYRQDRITIETFLEILRTWVIFR